MLAGIGYFHALGRIYPCKAQDAHDLYKHSRKRSAPAFPFGLCVRHVGFVQPPGRVFHVVQMRAIDREANYRPFEGKARVFLIDEADKFNDSSANALLKILEEPPRTSHIILITSRPAMRTISVIDTPWNWENEFSLFSQIDGGGRNSQVYIPAPGFNARTAMLW